jgi:hypothetical protein
VDTEASRRSIYQDALRGLGKFAFPLLDHKMDSDRRGKHEEWTPRKHVVLTTLAVLVDLGFNSGTVALALSGNVPGAGALKFTHIVGSQTLPQPITDFKNRLLAGRRSNSLSTSPHPK